MLGNISSLHTFISDSGLVFHLLPSFLSEDNGTKVIWLLLTALLLGSIILILEHHFFATRLYLDLAVRLAKPLHQFDLLMPLSPSRPRSGPIYARPTDPNDPTRRTSFTDSSVAIYGWPSRGGVIILEEATHVDFTFLGLSTTDPSLTRTQIHESDGKDHENVVLIKEDAFCQRLLLLGAKWWDSEARYRFVGRVGAGDEPAIKDVEDGKMKEPALRERRWVRVGWEETAAVGRVVGEDNKVGGLWVLDRDTNMHGILEEENLVPADAGRVSLARSMEERCEILKEMGARFFCGLEDYTGTSTFLRAWEWKWEGEIGELVKTG